MYSKGIHCSMNSFMVTGTILPWGGGSERGQNQPLSDKHNTLFPVNPVPAFSQVLISNAVWEIVRG